MVSVIIPNYNSEKYLKDTLDSVIRQTYKDLEIIVIDDCSTDNWEEVIGQFSDERIKVIKNEKNIGVSKTRNVGIENSNGEYIAFLDSDDVWEETKIEKQLNALEENDAVLVYTAVKYIEENGTPVKSGFVYQVKNDISYKDLLKQNVIACSSVLIKADVMKRYMFEKSSLHEDYIAWLKMLKANEKFFGLNEALLMYRLRDDGKSGNKFKSAKMTFKSYRFIGLNFFVSVRYFMSYMVRSLKKYKRIKSK